ncbi:MAG: hypothetical protein LUC98_01615 [Lachnospiraceae bacterium]|nr:hypothetical protein [Lachnospiraceae bacterium]
MSKRCANGYSYCIYCLENESKVSYAMPVRNMEFEATRYREQLRRIAAGHEQADYKSWDEFSSEFTKNDRLQPVIMLVLYWSRKPWDGARSLTEMLDIPDRDREQIAPFLQNYRLNLINMYELEHIESCQSPLKYALRLLQKDQNREAIYQEVQENPAYRKLDQETGRMMAVLLRDKKLEQYIEKQQKDERKETFNMCKALDDMRQEAMKCGIEQGISRGIEQGIEQGKSVGENCFARLTNFLLTDGRLEDLRRAIDNPATRLELYQEYHILY